jgi:hypothetical protein
MQAWQLLAADLVPAQLAHLGKAGTPAARLFSMLAADALDLH